MENANPKPTYLRLSVCILHTSRTDWIATAVHHRPRHFTNRCLLARNSVRGHYVSAHIVYSCWCSCARIFAVVVGCHSFRSLDCRIHNIANGKHQHTRTVNHTDTMCPSVCVRECGSNRVSSTIEMCAKWNMATLHRRANAYRGSERARDSSSSARKMCTADSRNRLDWLTAARLWLRCRDIIHVSNVLVNSVYLLHINRVSTSR